MREIVAFRRLFFLFLGAMLIATGITSFHLIGEMFENYILSNCLKTRTAYRRFIRPRPTRHLQIFKII